MESPASREATRESRVTVNLQQNAIVIRRLVRPVLQIAMIGMSSHFEV